MRIYHYPGCSTCKQALRWLAAHEIEVEAIDLVKATPSAKTLRELWTRSGLPLAKLFNTSGRAYRAGSFSERLPQMSEDEALAALAADGMLIKRPILDGRSFVLVGFDPARYAAAVGA